MRIILTIPITRFANVFIDDTAFMSLNLLRDWSHTIQSFLVHNVTI